MSLRVPPLRSQGLEANTLRLYTHTTEHKGKLNEALSECGTQSNCTGPVLGRMSTILEWNEDGIARYR